MNISAILVITSPERVEACIATLNQLPGVEVHHHEAASGKIIAIQEAENTTAEVDGLKRIKALDGIAMAEMINHYFEDDTQMFREIPTDINT